MTRDNKPPLVALLSAGKAARERAMKRAGSSRINSDAWFPEIMEMRDRGWRIKWIADGLQVTEHRVEQILREGREHRADLLEAPVYTGKLGGKDAALIEFTAEAFAGFFSRFSGREIQPHQYEWVAEFIEHRNLVLNVPPRHGKSTIFSVWVPIWLLCINRDEQILLVSKTTDLAIKFCREIEYQLSTNADLIRTYGRFAPDQVGEHPWRPGMGELLVAGRSLDTRSGDLSIQSRGMTQQILGMEATVAILDDITDNKVAMSPTGHVEEMRKVREEILTRLEPPKMRGFAAGRAVVVGQRVALYDVYSELSDDLWIRGPKKGEPLWYTRTQKAVLDWDTQAVLWPTKYDWEEIEHLRAHMGEASFEMMYQQNPRPEGTQIIRAEWLEACRDLDRDIGDGPRGKPGTLPTARVMSIDPSPTQWNSACIADVTSFRGGWGMVVVEDRWWKGKGAEFKAEVERAITMYRIQYLVIEESTFFSWVKEDPWFENLSRRVKLIKHHTGVNKNDLELGADSLAVDYEMGTIRNPFGSPAAKEATLRAETEALDWSPFAKIYDNHMARWFIKWNRASIRPVFNKPDHFVGSSGSRVNASGRVRQQAAERAKAGRRRYDQAS